MSRNTLIENPPLISGLSRFGTRTKPTQPRNGEESESSIPLIIGILNVTPDSFSDGGRYLDATSAISHGESLISQGVDIIDVGGESTRPGADAVTEEEELRRAVPVVRELARMGAIVSIDTTKANVARQCCEVGASIVNDVSAGRADPPILDVVAAAGAGYIVMHMQGTPRTMQQNPTYGDVTREVAEFLEERVCSARAAGITDVWADPGVGFGKTTAHNLTLLAEIPQLVDTLDVPIVIGTSRKSFIGKLLGTESEPLLPGERDEGTQATTVWALTHGASAIRVHNVAAAVAARKVVTQGALV